MTTMYYQFYFIFIISLIINYIHVGDGDSKDIL
jgi:hypothetical protein